MMHILLEGIVGSRAYNLAHKDSDTDKKGIFAFDTDDLFKLNYRTLSEVVETHAPEPDNTWYEVAKWCNLALKCNPNILELVFLPKDLYTIRTPLGDSLISIRQAFLSAPAIRGAYINYARSQLHQIENQGNFGSDMKKRTEKHARHLVRLMMQGFQLFKTGELDVRLDDDVAAMVKNIGLQAGQGNLEPIKIIYNKYKTAFDETFPAIPETPDRDTVESWLIHVREIFLKV